MGMSTHIVGLRPPDERWQQMKTLYDAAQAAGVPVPAQVLEFFDGMPPDPQGVEVRIESTTAVREWKDDVALGFEVDVRELPPEVHIIRFYNSW